MSAILSTSNGTNPLKRNLPISEAAKPPPKKARVDDRQPSYGYSEVIDYSENGLFLKDAAPIVERIKKCASVSRFSIHLSKVCLGEVLNALAEKTSDLSVLEITYCKRVPGDALKRLLSRCNQLARINFDGLHRLRTTNLLSAIPVRGLQTLTELNIGSCGGVDDDDLTEIAQHCQSLRSLSIEDCEELSARSLDALSKVSSLTELVMHGNKHFAEDGVREALTSATFSLKRLNLSWCQNLSDETVAAIVAKHSRLSSLFLEYLESVSQHSLGAIGNLTTHLRKLNLAGCSLSRPYLGSLGACINLKVLSLEGLSLKHRELDSFAPHLPNLEQLDLSGSVDLRDSDLEALKSNFCKITHLNLSYCFAISVEAFSELTHHSSTYGFRNLESLVFEELTQLDDDALETICRKAPLSLKKIDITRTSCRERTYKEGDKQISIFARTYV